MSNAFSLTPGFSPVPETVEDENRFNGFPGLDKLLKRLPHRVALAALLKRGAYEMNGFAAHFCEYH